MNVSALRQRLIARIYGDGFSAMVAAALTDRAIVHLQHAVRKPHEIIDVSKLVPGETYVVVTRPAPSRKERKLEQAAIEAQRKVERATRPRRATIRLERQLVRATRRVEAATPGSRRWARATAEVQKGEQELERRLRPSKKAVRLEAEATAATARLTRQRDRAFTKARKKARPPRRRVWR